MLAYEMIAYYIIISVIVLFVLYNFRQGNIYKPFFLIATGYILIFLVGALLFDAIRIRGSKLHLVPFIVNNLLLIILGIYLSKFRILPRIDHQISSRYFTTIKSKELILCLSGIGIIAAMFYFLRIGTIPLFSPDADSAKVTAMAGSGYIRIFMLALPVICLFMWYDYLQKPTKKQMMITYVIVSITMIITALSGSRSGIVFLGAEMTIIYLFTKKRKLSLVKGFFGLVFLYALLVTLGAYRHFNGVITWNNLVGEMATIITARAAALDNILARTDEMLMGKTFLLDIRKILPGEQTGLGVYVKETYFSNNRDMLPSKAGMNTTILGEMFINFGTMGTYVAMLIYGFLAGKIYRVLTSVKSRETIVLYSMLIMTMVGALQTALGPHLPNLIYMLFWFFVVSTLARKRIVFQFHPNIKPDTAES